MASIVFGAVAAKALGGAGTTAGLIGGLIGTAAGSILDQQVLFPKLFPSDSGTLGPLDIPSNQTVADGANANIVIGREAFCFGQVIYLGPRQRGTGDDIQVVRQDVGVLIAKNQIAKVLEIRAQGEPILIDIDSTTSATGTVTLLSTISGLSGTTFFLGRTVLFIADYANSNFSGIRFQGLQEVTISGSSEPLYNTTYAVFSTNVEGANLRVTMTSVGAVAEVTESVTVKASFVSNKIVGGVNFHLGDGAQVADSTIQGDESDVPAWRGMSYIVINDMFLEGFGGVPPIFSFVIQENATRMLGEAIDIIMNRAGFADAEFDVSTLNTIPFPGITINGLTPLRDVLNPLIIAYNLNVVEEGGKIVFTQRGSETPITINAADISVRESGDNSIPREVEFKDLADVDIPNHIVVTHIDPAFDYQQGAVGRPSASAAFSRSSQVQLPMVLDRDDAGTIQQRLQSEAVNERQEINMSIPWKYLNASPGDHFSFTIQSQAYTLRVEELKRGNNYTLQARGIVVNTDTSAEAFPTESIDAFVTTTPEPIQMLEYQVLDLPAIFDEDVLNPLVYFGVYAANSQTAFRGAAIFKSENNIDFIDISRTIQDHVIGKALTALATTTDFFNFDFTNTVDVEVFSGSLQSIAESRVVKERQNMALLGTEIIYFQTATLIATNQYRLSGLLRGTRNTEDQVATHAIDERFVLLNSEIQDDIAKAPLTFSDIGKTVFFSVKGVNDSTPVGTVLGTPEGTSITVELKTLKPFSPTDAVFSNDGTDVTVEWKRRSRAFGGELQDGGTPLVDDVELWTVNLLKKAGGFHKSYFIGTTSQIILNADMTAAGYTPIEDITVEIKQRSPIFGFGKTLTATGS